MLGYFLILLATFLFVVSLCGLALFVHCGLIYLVVSDLHRLEIIPDPPHLFVFREPPDTPRFARPPPIVFEI